MPPTEKRTFEQEYVRALGDWMACRLAVMGGEVEGQPYDFESWLIGMVSQEHELRLICEEERSKRNGNCH